NDVENQSSSLFSVTSGIQIERRIEKIRQWFGDHLRRHLQFVEQQTKWSCKERSVFCWNYGRQHFLFVGRMPFSRLKDDAVHYVLKLSHSECSDVLRIGKEVQDQWDSEIWNREIRYEQLAAALIQFAAEIGQFLDVKNVFFVVYWLANDFAWICAG